MLPGRGRRIGANGEREPDQPTHNFPSPQLNNVFRSAGVQGLPYPGVESSCQTEAAGGRDHRQLAAFNGILRVSWGPSFPPHQQQRGWQPQQEGAPQLKGWAPERRGGGGIGEKHLWIYDRSRSNNSSSSPVNSNNPNARGGLGSDRLGT